MPQSSLMAWLNKPNAVKELPATVQTDDKAQSLEIPTALQEHEQSASPKTSPSGKAASLKFSVIQKPLPPNVELRSCTKDDIPHLKRLTSLLLPITYPEKFYKEITEDPLTNNITLLAVWHDEPVTKGVHKGRLVGAIRCRLLAPPILSPQAERDGKPMLYLSTLALLSPFRSHGIATHLLQEITKRASDAYGISSVGAHVWAANTEGLEWYRKRGFREVNKETGYYRKLDPQTAVVMRRDVGVLDLIAK